jgi:hypothetical protein
MKKLVGHQESFKALPSVSPGLSYWDLSRRLADWNKGVGMPKSLHLRFFCDLQPSNVTSHPAGESVANVLRKGLVQRGWSASDLDNWRDSGWVFICMKNRAALQLVLAEMATKSEWLVQISPNYIPGLVGWIFGWKSSGSPKDIYLNARDLQETVATLGQFSRVLWCWDNIPDDINGSSQPTCLPEKND